MENSMQSLNSLFTDSYEFTMAKALYEEGKQNDNVNFNLFFRRVPQQGGFVLAAGLEQAIEYVRNIKFTEEQLNFLKHTFDLPEQQINDLRNFKFQCDVKAVKEGTPVFPNEPLLSISGPAWQCMLVEVGLLNAINYQSLIATRASRMAQAADGRAVLEFGARRAQSGEAAIFGSRAAYIGGCSAVSLVEAGKRFGIPVKGTMAHSFMQFFGNDYDAFTAYVKAYPDNPTLLVDTYDVIKSGIPNTIRVFKEQGITKGAIRLDSGDLADLSKRARKMFDDAGLMDIKITASNALDEQLITSLIRDQDAPIDAFGVGEKLITGAPEPVLGCVYKLDAVGLEPRIKVSENAAKTTLPGRKDLYRLYNKDGKAFADVVTVEGEQIEQPFPLFDANEPTKHSIVSGFTTQPLLVPVFEKGVRVYQSPSVQEIRDYAQEQLGNLYDEVKRFDNPDKYWSDLSPELWELREGMIMKARGLEETKEAPEQQVAEKYNTIWHKIGGKSKSMYRGDGGDGSTVINKR